MVNKVNPEPTPDWLTEKVAEQGIKAMNSQNNVPNFFVVRTLL